MSIFSLKASSQKARAGTISLPHGIVQTPIFMPVGTVGSVKSVSSSELTTLGAQIILGNTYHLWLRPGLDVIRNAGTLHKFISWKKPILTDSGGFQVFSLQGTSKITDEGVTFRSHLDGSLRHLTPEVSLEIQSVLGSDIAMAFDHCPSGLSDENTLWRAMQRTTEWAKRCLTVPPRVFTHSDGQIYGHQQRFGIVQGGTSLDLRKSHIEQICSMPFDGFALGGFAVGEPIPVMYELLDQVAHLLPADKPRYLMGVGTPMDLLVAIRSGVDMFDCVMPTRNARNGQLFTSTGKINIKRAEYQLDLNPLDASCSCETCVQYSRSYLRHLFVSKEILYYKLASLHNLTFYLNLVKQAREAILQDRYEEFFEQQAAIWK